MKTVMICALGYTKSDYHDYPQDWEYVEWSRRNIDSVADFLFTLLGKDINIPTKNIKAIRACFDQVRQLKQRTIKQIPKIGVYAYRGTAVPPEDIRAERVVVKTNRDPYAIPYSQWKAGV